ncbi:hypothetical protein JVT61DRAFT_416 [Boletus reticuloceps]|uniref:LisH domain-containing protein n=1 Tax=Boletus reticuloceps TaxID=495285 RepID=A0A8I2Z1P2_9AGAM|nr:hypothetical protein JVT61DRAFT_416 [Boletus reticuloceps]
MANGPPGSMSLPTTDIQSSSDPSWEGDRMFNIYIYDYCNKRGFRKTARELLTEAEIPPDSAPPINAKQGLLFEWWSVFWVLFTAKSNGAGTEDAMVYTQAGLKTSQSPNPSSKSYDKWYANNTTPDPARRAVPNSPGPSSALGNPAQMPFPMVGAGPQPNGIPIQSTGSTPAGPNPAPPQNFSTLMPGQRPGAPQHRGPNGVNPYQSPTMAHSHSPQNPGGNAGPNPQNPMNHLGLSPHLTHMARAGMLPPNANMGSGPHTQTPPFSQLARSPSRPGSPGQVMQRSPSLMDRQTPVNHHESNLNAELSRLPTNILTSIRQDLGVLDKELQSLTFDEKNRIVTLARQRGANQAVRKPGPGGPQVLQHGQLPNSENSPPERKRVRRSSASMDQVPPVGYPHQPHQQVHQQMMNGGMMRPGLGPMPGGPGPLNNFPPHGPSAMANPGMGIPMGVPGNTMSPGMGGPRAPNMIGQLQYHQGVHAVTKGLAMANLPGGGSGTPTPGDPPFNQGPGQPFPGPQNNRLGQNKPMGMMPPPSPAGGPPKEQPKEVNKPPGQNWHRRVRHETSSHRTPQRADKGRRIRTAVRKSARRHQRQAQRARALLRLHPLLSMAHRRSTQRRKPTTSLPEVPASFLTNEFMQSVASTLDDFDTQALFRPEDTGINFEQDFREWFNPDDLDMK